jgi:tripartite-type tricarboxylate transporter receptor subunit TctC
MRKHGIHILIAIAAVFGLATFGISSLLAADYPQSPISMIVSYSPGGATDFQARIVSMMAGDEAYFGQPIVIINKPGAGGQVGWNWTVRSTVPKTSSITPKETQARSL